MDERPEDRRFSTSEELLKHVREHVDDIENVVIPITKAEMEVRDAQGTRRRVMSGVGAVVKLCGGRSFVLSREDAAMLINDGVLQRLKIKCMLDPS